MPKRVWIITSYPPVPRIERRILSYQKAGFDVTLFYWCRDGVSKKESYKDLKVDIYEFLKKTLSGNPVKRIRKTISFKNSVIKAIKKNKVDVLHVQDLDLFILLSRFCHRRHIKIVYEVRDLHDILLKKHHGIKQAIQHFLISSETRKLKYVSLMVITSDKFIDFYKNRIDLTKVIFIPNKPDLNCLAKYQKKEKKDFTIGFIGKIRYFAQMDNLIAASVATSSKLFIAGSCDNKEYEKKLIDSKEIDYFGPFLYSKDISALYSNVDCIYCVYDSSSPNVRIALPNKLYECVFCILPLIVSKGTYLSEVVEHYGLGIAVDSNSPEELKEAIKRLRDRSFYNGICLNIQNIREDFLDLKSEDKLVSAIKEIM